MKIRIWLGSAWAAIKGLLSFGTTPRLAVVDYFFELAYEYYGKVEWIVKNVARAHKALAWICDALDVYARYIPEPWMKYFDNVLMALKCMRDMLADGKIEREELERVAKAIREAVVLWRT